jgi:molybdopterin-guanine dinucleotide biosynthesis protein A
MAVFYAARALYHRPMHEAAAIVLAGGRSTRMGSAKAALDWHGSTLLWRVSGILARSVDGPVIVVRAADQRLPELLSSVEVVADGRADRGPLEGLAAGLRQLSGRARVAYLSSTDVPFLHPAFVRAVTAALGDQVDVALPEVDGHHQPLAAAYRPQIIETLEELLAADELRPASLYARCRVRRLTGEDLLGDRSVALHDAQLASLRNVNDPSQYADAYNVSGPMVTVEWRAGSSLARKTVTAWSLGAAATTVGIAVDAKLAALLNGEPVFGDPRLPLVADDDVSFA